MINEMVALTANPLAPSRASSADSKGGHDENVLAFEAK